MYQQLGLLGARRIVFEDMCQLLAAGDQVSVSRLVAVTGYDHSTVHRALKSLRRDGVVEMTHRANGAPAQYRIATRANMIDFQGLMRALFNIITASSDERARRMMMAWVSKRIYDRGKRLKRLVAKIEKKNGLATAINGFLEDNNILDVFQVWDIEAGNLLLAQVNDYIEIVEELLEKGQ